MSAIAQSAVKSTFQLKSGFCSSTVFKCLSADLDAIKQQLIETTAKAPQFFAQSPVILDLSLVPLAVIDFAELKALLQQYGMIAIGVTQANEEQLQLAIAAGLPPIHISNKTPPAESPPKETNSTAMAINDGRYKTEIITYPLRSGMQVYGKDSNVIVTSTISYGAEVMADGYIHSYGILRGKVLAGAKGDKSARIFCRQLQAELVGIAGFYLMHDEIISPKENNLLQIYLENEKLIIESI